VQRRRHRPDDVIADEHRQREDRQAKDEGIDRAARGGVAGGGELVGVGLRGARGLFRRVGGRLQFGDGGVKVFHRSLV